MKKVDSDGATVGLEFDDGDPGIPIVSTLIEETWLNSVQRELIEVVEFSAQVPDQSNVDTKQLRKGIEIIAFGATGGNNLTQSILNNQAPIDITSLVFDKTKFVGARFLFRIHRQTDSGNRDEIGEAFVWFRDVQNDWQLSLDSKFTTNDAGVTLTITAAGQVRYASNDLAGASYAGQIKITNVIRIAA